MIVRLVAWALLFFQGCGAGVVIDTRRAPTPPKGMVSLRIIVEPADAEIYLDGRFMGTVDRYRDGWIAFEPSTKRLRLERLGFYTWYMLREPGDQSKAVRARLVKKPRSGESR